jgi:sodium/pantothenate symporter
MFLVFMAATVVFVVYIVDGLGGIGAAITDMARLESKAGIASWTGIVGEGTDWPTPLDYVIWAVVMDIAWALVYAVSPWQASRHLMARDEHVVLRAAILACFCVIFLQMLVYGVAGLMNLAKVDITPSETVLIWAAKTMVPELLGAFLLAGIVAAALSSASTFLSLVGFSVSNDMGSKPLALSVSATRKIMLITSLIALVCCYFFPPNLFWFMLFIGTVFASSWGPVGLMSIWSKRITADAAFWGMVSGFFMNVIPAAIDHLGIYHMPEYFPAAIGIVFSTAVICVVSAFGKVSREEKIYRMRLHRPPQSDIDRAKTMKTLLAPLGLVVYGIAMPLLLLKYYVIPYQIGTGEILSDGRVNWNTAEALIALSAFALHVPLALIAMKLIWSRYNPQTERNQKILRRARLKDEAGKPSEAGSLEIQRGIVNGVSAGSDE